MACSVALLAPLFAPLLTGRVFVFNDLSRFHLPLRWLYQHALMANDSLLWTPSLFAGFYLHGEGQGGFFHPFHQLIYRALPLGVAFNLELVANYPVAFGGMYWLLRRLHFSQVASLFAAMLFAFSGFNLLHHHHVNMVAVVAHIPWLLAASDALIVEKDNRTTTGALAAIALLVGSELLLGFPQAVWWNMLTLAAFAPFRAWQTAQLRRLIPLAGAVGLGIALGGIQLLPTLDLAVHSKRAGLPGEFALTYSLHPANLLQLWSPYAFERGAHSVGDYMWFHEFGIYSGAILPLAAIWTWVRRSSLTDRKALIVWATVVAVVSLILALGRYGGLAALFTYVPVLQSLRAPVRYVFLMQFALAILAAVTLDDLLSIFEGKSQAPTGNLAPLWMPLLLGIATTVALNGRLMPFGRHILATVQAAAPGVAIVGVVTLLLYLSARRVRWALAALIVVTAADLAGWGLRFVFREPAKPIADLTAGIPPAPDVASEAYAAAPIDGDYSANVLILSGYRLTNGYVGLFPASRYPLESELTLKLSGTRWLFTIDGQRTRAPDVMPRVRLLDENRNDATGTARVSVDSPGRIVVDVDTPDRRVLALTERFHEGWSVTVSNQAARSMRVTGDFLGCAVESGIQRIEFTFMPRSFVYGAILSAVGVLLLAAILVIRLK